MRVGGSGELIFCGVLCTLLLWGSLLYGDKRTLVDERFVSLDHWQPLIFKNVRQYSTYLLTEEDGTPCLLMSSDGGASALLMREPFDVYQFPRLTWRWKISNIFAAGDSGLKRGDDYPARMNIMFAYDPEHSSLLRKMTYEAMKMLYGTYPPDSSLSYIWANKPGDKEVIVSAYTESLRMIPVERGQDKTGTWQQYTVDIVADYRRAFDRDPPRRASLAVMIDSDDTGESARAWIDFIIISR